MNDYVNIQLGGEASPMYPDKYFYPFVWFIYISYLEKK
jgi:hypothetical protein